MRNLVLGLAGTAAMTVASAASATLYMGATAGCFSPGPPCAPATTQTYGGLTFDTGSFNQSDVNGFLAIGSAAENFGTFSLTGVPFNYNAPPTLFTLLVNFTLPTGAGANTFSALVSGTVGSDNSGGLFVDFDNTAHSYPSDAGAFTLTLNDLGINSGGSATHITGTINAVGPDTRDGGVPEPATWGLMLLGFAGIGMAMRRRRQPVLAQLA